MRFLDQLIVSPLADGIQWALMADFRYESNIAGLITVPGPKPPEHGGFISDFTSSPTALQALIPPWQIYGSAAILHDWLYHDQQTDRETADAVLREAMTVLAVDQNTIGRIWTAVRTFGSFAWARNAKLKASGYTRMASTNSTPPYAAAI